MIPREHPRGRGAFLRRWSGALFVAYAVIEVLVALTLARAIGAGWTILLLLAVSVLGGSLVRRELAAAFQAARRDPSTLAPRRLTAGVAAAGLVAVPGLVTGVLGLLLLTPPGRRVLGGRAGSRRPGDPTVIDGEVVDGEVLDPPDRRLGP